MSLVSNLFLLFVLASVLVYYIVPHKWQWLALLVFSYIYYIAGGLRFVVFILFSTIVTWLAALMIEKVETKGNHKAARKILIFGLILNFGMLGGVKYTNFAIENLNALFHMNLRGMAILLPLGISFYTFQSSGYLLDVYWKRCEAEKHPLKYALFVSFFPQILQGPIGRYSRLANQLYAPHKFEGKNIARGFERILWGFFKKMILADWAAVFVDEIFANPDQYSGLALIGILLYTLQLYADFSGGMDVVIGIASMFGIELDENFKRPFFAVSVTDFWHRWHITLGTWMKDYVFYPVTLSRWMGSFSKWAKKVFGRKTGRTLPICIANIVVFFVVGVWHGAAWKFIIYGLYNGLIIAFSGLMAGNYRSWKKKFHISGKETWYYVFTVVRTFIITVISMYFDRPDNMGVALHMMKLSVTRFNPSQILLIPAGKQGTAFTPYALLILAVGCVILFVVSVLQERGMKIRESLAKLPLPVTAAVYFCLLISIGFFGSTAVARGFIYAQF
ncbi:MBOAT family O-acyltransferase [Blautia intestinalis]|uniref:MBOAT family O-acyltransferase n=1 Tax=Blautia intestinalis TaxID=2763028 RepID=UPI0022E5850F|nr:MBOAT family O-acyltransferase [Blautia intestinalis]